MISKTTSNYSLFTEKTTGAWSVVFSVFRLHIIYKTSLHNTSFRNTPQKRTLGRQGFKVCCSNGTMQLFIHPWFNGFYRRYEWPEDV